MKSSRQRNRQILGMISANRAEALLVEWMNSPDKFWRLAPSAVLSGPIRKLTSDYPEVFAAFRQNPTLLIRVLTTGRDLLRAAWDAPDSRHRLWWLYRAREQYHNAMNETLPPEFTTTDVPEPTAFEATVFHFQMKLADKARHCLNPICPAPYFFAVKKGQKYCSPECALPAQQESKRLWWQRNRAKNGGLK